MKKNKSNYCPYCEKSSSYHFQTWIDGLFSSLFPPLKLPKTFGQFLNLFLEKILIFLNVFKLKKDFDVSKIQHRTACFIEEGRKNNLEFKALCSSSLCTDNIQVKFQNKTIRFKGLPIADFSNRKTAALVDNKAKTKKRLEKNNFPVAKGRGFWFWQEREAINFGINNIGFPLVVKPQNGSLNRHVTTNIKNKKELKRAIKKALDFSPIFLIEEFIPNTYVHRGTVINFDYVACVKQIPANITGDGISTIEDLIDKKNNDSARIKNPVHHEIVKNRALEKTLKRKGYNLSTIIKKGEFLFLQENDFLRLGGDLIEVTPQTHPDNIQLFSDIAKALDIKVTGIDFLIKDISKSWKNQPCAILELNSLPSIELHHYPLKGKPNNIAKPLINLFFKHYL